VSAKSESSVGFGELSAEPRDPGVPGSRFLAARRVSVDEGYRLWASHYDGDPNPLLALEERELRALLPGVGGKDVVDVACGTGRWLTKLMSLGARSATGVDLSDAMLEIARAKRPLRGHLLRAECTALPIRSESADLIICSFAMGHFGDPAPLASELARVAKRGADVYLTDLHPEGYARGWRTGFRGDGELIEITTFAPSAEQLRGAFISLGFAVIQFLDAYLGEPERGIFAQAGRPHRFETACKTPAVLICHLQRLWPFGGTA